ncbi:MULTISPECIES: hypothetical protein [unclassified Flavobacterium]|uniref:hypothetical protein n=1 Tax=unclassified Flavobacterium TaxID=196869 RepID=UPI001F13F46C|nr:MULTISPECIES: hypothetical protein [unclassified Flavobacterium]UMY66898.1 hypothetical protein MKO97_05810 [Flavobacterium sp. HJ-32-4]
MSVYQSTFEQFRKGYYANCAIAILVQSCLGGIAAMAILEHGTGLLQMFQLMLVVIACVSFNGTILSVRPPRTVFNWLVGALLLCVFVAIVNFAA